MLLIHHTGGSPLAEFDLVVGHFSAVVIFNAHARPVVAESAIAQQKVPQGNV
jgi:hypothetical protein